MMVNVKVELNIEEEGEVELKPKGRRRSVKPESDDEYVPPQKKKTSRKSSAALPTPSGSKTTKAEKVYTCRKCFKEFVTRKALYDHNKTHDTEDLGLDKHTFKFDEKSELYICNTCSAEFQAQEEVEKHISKIHEEMYTCETCQNVSHTAYQYAMHLKTHTEGDMLSCPLCNYTTLRRTCLQTHINRIHYHKFYYYCKTCGKGFNDSAIFKEHNNEHLGIKAFSCVVCNKEFMFSRYLNLHQTRAHTVHISGILHRNQCSICLKVFSKMETLLKHITTKHNKNAERVRKHLCDICGNSFGSRDKMKIHYRVHTGDKPYSCSYCEKKFTKKDYLVMHERVHTGEKPYPCDYCGKCFNQAASLRIHVRGHTGERPYICQFCNGGYISRGSLNLHMKICNGVASD